MQTAFELREYQQKFADQVVQYLAQFMQIIACAATGSGKTRVFLYLAKRALAKGLTVLILTESSKIYEQLTQELHAGNINSQRKDGLILPGHAYIAMAQTLARRQRMVKQFQEQGQRLLIINDEAHIGTATKLLQDLLLNGPYLIGFTATPDWRFAKHLPVLYKACVVGPQPDELVNAGYLSSYKHFARVLANLDDLKIKNGEFTEESQEAIFESRKVYDGLLQDLRCVTFKKAVVFTASIKHCDDVYDQLQAAGFSCVKIHSKAPHAGFDMARYREMAPSSPNICVSVGILTKGWDFPAVDLVILNRATTSLPLYLQMIGRGSRISPEKPSFTVLDYGGNYERHGLWDTEIDWQKKWRESKRKKKEGIAPIKMCPMCEYINPISMSVCKNCGYIFPPAQEEVPVEEETKLVELTEKYRTLVGLSISELTPPQLALYAKFKNKKAYAIRVAKSQEQRQPGWLDQFASIMGYKNGWLYYQLRDMSAEPIQFIDQIIR